VPLTLDIDGHLVVDDETFDQADFLKRVGCQPQLSQVILSVSAPVHGSLYLATRNHVYAVTLSAELSGSYNSAELGKKLYEEEYGEKKIHIFQFPLCLHRRDTDCFEIEACEKAGMSLRT